MADHPDLKPYIACLEEIKARYKIIASFGSGERNAIFDVPTVEVMALQFRMIFELVALASLSAHARLFEEQQIKFEKKWNPGDILKDIKKINPNFYPRPIIERKSATPGVKNDLLDMPDGFLTPEELVKAHGMCGNILHARNPFGKGVDHNFYRNEMANWSKKLVALLSIHQIKLLNGDFFYLIHLHGNPDGKIRTYTFQRVDA